MTVHSNSSTPVWVLPLWPAPCQNGRWNWRLQGKDMEAESVSTLWTNHSEAFVAAIAAVLAALIALISAFWASRASDKAQKLQKAALSMEVDRACLDWGHEAIDALARARGLVMSPRLHAAQGEFEAAKANLSATLSGLADRGRLFFLNYDPGQPQPDIDTAYQGSRPAILFPLILAHYELEALEFKAAGHSKALSDFLFNCRRLFVSELQDFVDPVRRNQASDRQDHRGGQARTQAMKRAAELALDLEIRRPGLLLQYHDQGILDRISDDERKRQLHGGREVATP
ncbi:MAG: hypothetical protein AAF829_02875 [Pseudomonadota bacterium]